MAPRPRLLTLAARRLVGGLAALLSVALVVVDAGYAPASQSADTVPSAHADTVPRALPREVSEPAPEDGGAGPVRAGDLQGDEAQAEQAVGAAEQAVGPAEPDAPAQVPSTHVVQPGETAGEIADRYGVATRTLVRANRHARPETLQPGDLLVVPDPGVDQPLTPQAAMAANLEVEQILDETARRYGWNPATVKAIAWYESRWNQRLVSDQEAIGVMQVQPATGQLMERLLGRPLDLHDVHDNVEAGVAYLDRLHAHYRGDLRAIIAAYHQGPEALRTRGIYPVSDVYTDEVLRLRTIFGR